MSWVYLTIGILFEVMGTTSMKLSHGLTKLGPSIFIFLFYGVSFSFVAASLKKIEMSVAYTIWSGVGTALVVGIGVFWFGESMTPLKAASIVLILAGVIGLRLSGSHG